MTIIGKNIIVTGEKELEFQIESMFVILEQQPQ